MADHITTMNYTVGLHGIAIELSLHWERPRPSAYITIVQTEVMHTLALCVLNIYIYILLVCCVEVLRKMCVL